MTRWRIAIASSYAVMAAGMSASTESCLTARRAHFSASVSISLEDNRGGRGGEGSLGGFRRRRV